MIFEVVTRHGEHYRRITLDAADEQEARAVAKHQSQAITLEHGTPLYEVDTIERVGSAEPRPVSFWDRLLGRSA